MNQVNFDLQPEWLRRHEMPVPDVRPEPRRLSASISVGSRRRFKVAVAGENFVLSVQHLPVGAAEAFTAAEEEPRTPSDAEVLLLIARAFLGSLPVHPPAEPDVEKAWEACQRQARETLPAGYGGKAWADLLPEEREAFSVGVRAAFQPSTLNSQLSTSQP